MKRSKFRSRFELRPPKQIIDYTPRPRATAVAQAENDAAPVVMPKSAPCRSEAYRRLVAALPCIVCGRPGPSQAAHADQGKGMAIKSDDRTCYPACATLPGRASCHDLIGSGGLYTRDERRVVERVYGARTRATILALGLWPKSVEPWPDGEQALGADEQPG
jgi:hypothetical protein